MNESLKVSIIVPIYNASAYLCECVESLVSQTYNNLEIMLIDDGSKDESPVICDAFAERDSRVKVIHKVNAGVSAARQTGIDESSGEYILFVDADDRLDDNTVKTCIEAVNKNPEIDCVLFSYTKETENSSTVMHVFDGDRFFPTKKEVSENIHRRIFGLSNDELNHPERLENLTTCWMKLYKRNLVLDGKFIDIKKIGSCEDGIFNMYALKNCECAVYLDKPMYHYRKITNSLSSGYRPNLISQWENLFGIFRDEIAQSNLGECYTESLDNRVALSIIGIGLNELHNKNTNFFKYYGYIRKYLNLEWYRNSVKKCKIEKLPLVWKVLMFSCKHRLSLLVTVIMYAIKIMK